MPQHPQMRSYKILSGFNRFLMAKNLGNKKKFAQIGQCIREISRKPVSGPPRGLWRLQIMPQHPQMRSYKILSGFNRFPMAKNLGNKIILISLKSIKQTPSLPFYVSRLRRYNKYFFRTLLGVPRENWGAKPANHLLNRLSYLTKRLNQLKTYQIDTKFVSLCISFAEI